VISSNFNLTRHVGECNTDSTMVDRIAARVQRVLLRHGRPDDGGLCVEPE